MTHLWEADHAYYCSESNYFATYDKTVTEYKSWAEFAAVEGDADMDYNLIFRWDWSLIDSEAEPPEDDHYRGYNLTVFWMGQRKGLFRCTIVQVCRADEKAVVDFLRPRWEYMRKLWEPVGTEGGE